MTSLVITIGIVLSTYSSLPYIREIIRGSVRPRIASWSVWTILAGVMTVSAFVEGQIPSALLSLVSFVGCATILVLGWKRGGRELSRIDVVCIVGAVLGIGSLVVLRDPSVAILVSVGVDAIAFVPTLIHGWTDPEEESFGCFALAAAGAACALIAGLLSGATMSGLAYPVYAVAFNGMMAAVLFISQLTYRSDEVYE